MPVYIPDVLSLAKSIYVREDKSRKREKRCTVMASSGTGDNLRSTIRPYNGDNVPHPTHAPFSTANIHPFTDVSLPAGQQLENYLYTRYSNSLFLAKTSLYIGLATK